MASGPKSDASAARLRTLHAASLRRVASLASSFDGIVEATSDVATDDEHDPEGHTIAWERQQIAGLLDEARGTSADIEAAEHRLVIGRYGRCTSCDGAIAAERLDALPATPTCVGCARSIWHAMIRTMSSDLFSAAGDERRQTLAPLADRMRPRTLDELAGQERLAGEGGRLRRQLAAGHVPNMVLQGPPGTGKTTIARLVARETGMAVEELSAVAAGLADVRRVVAEAKARLGGANGGEGRQTVLFLDEIHRFNRTQQDALLPSVEDGTIRLVGATTENPYVSINKALLSRCVVYQLEPIPRIALGDLLRAAAADSERGLSRSGEVTVDDGAIELVLDRTGGDARRALTLLEAAALLADGDTIGVEEVGEASDARRVRYDRAGDEHYDHASAYIKSMRGGDADGAIRWLAQMLEGGEDPLFIARRLAIFAAEDVGNAKPNALVLATAAQQHVEAVGMPECRIALAQVTRFCAEAPKSRQAFDDIEQAMADVRDLGTGTVPPELTNRKAPARPDQDI